MTNDDSRPYPRLSDPHLSAKLNIAPPGPARPEPLRAPAIERGPPAAADRTFYVLATVMLVLVLVVGGLALDRMGSRWMQSHWPSNEAHQQDRPTVPAIGEQRAPTIPLPPSGPVRP